MADAKMWLTKYALTGGIQECSLDRVGANTAYVYLKEHTHGAFVLGREVFYSRDEAVEDANKRRAAKIVSLKKQITKLESQAFK